MPARLADGLRSLPRPDHHRTVRHVLRGERQPLHASLKAVGTGQQIKLARTQRLDGLFTLGKPGDLHRDIQLVTDQPHVIGADTLITVAVAGDVDRLVISDGNTDPNDLVLIEPLPVLRLDDEIVRRHERRGQGKR